MKKLVMGVILAGLLLMSGEQVTYAAEDFEYWPMMTAKIKINDKVNINILEEFRLKEDMGNFYLYNQYIGPSYKLNDHWSFALWYKLVSDKANKDWSESHRWDIDATFSWKFKDIRLSNRGRFENNITKSTWLYRNRIKASKKVTLFDFKVTPYMQNEFFFDMNRDTDGYHENRGTVGIKFPFIMDTDLSIYYMARGKKSTGDWNTAHVFGTVLAAKF